MKPTKLSKPAKNTCYPRVTKCGLAHYSVCMTSDLTSLKGLTILMSGGSRGIGLAIAKRAAADGASIVLLAKTAQAHDKLEGTIYTAQEEIEVAGGKALPVVGDVRNDDDVAAAVARAVETFGGIDIVVNNASAIDLRKTPDLDMKKYDLMQDINARGSFLMAKTALPHLLKSQHPHILTMSPPINLDPKWAGGHVAYTISKYSMSLVTLGLAEELKEHGVGVNSLWPATLIDTAAIRAMPHGPAMAARGRSIDIVGDAAHAILTSDPRELTGRFLTDEEILKMKGITDLGHYAATPGNEELIPDAFL